MAAKCELCGKGPQFGNNISHANNTTRRRWNVNLHPVTVKVAGAEQAHPRVQRMPQDGQSRQRLSTVYFREQDAPAGRFAAGAFRVYIAVLRGVCHCAELRIYFFLLLLYFFSNASEALLIQ